MSGDVKPGYKQTEVRVEPRYGLMRSTALTRLFRVPDYVE